MIIPRLKGWATFCAPHKQDVDNHGEGVAAVRAVWGIRLSTEENNHILPLGGAKPPPHPIRSPGGGPRPPLCLEGSSAKGEKCATSVLCVSESSALA